MRSTLIYFDNDLQEEFSIPAFEDVTPSTLREKYDDAVYRAIYEALIRLAANSEWGAIPCFAMNGVIFEIDRGLHEEHYKNCLNYFTASEEFEICAHLVRLNGIL
jgi:hypothetical protein